MYKKAFNVLLIDYHNSLRALTILINDKPIIDKINYKLDILDNIIFKEREKKETNKERKEKE